MIYLRFGRDNTLTEKKKTNGGKKGVKGGKKQKGTDGGSEQGKVCTLLGAE